MTSRPPQSGGTTPARAPQQTSVAAWHAFGPCLQQAREAASLSRRVLAQQVGLDTSYIYRVETGARRPSREAALALGRVGRERGRLSRLFSRPPSEPDVRLSPHPALQFPC